MLSFAQKTQSFREGIIADDFRTHYLLNKNYKYMDLYLKPRSYL